MADEQDSRTAAEIDNDRKEGQTPADEPVGDPGPLAPDHPDAENPQPEEVPVSGVAGPLAPDHPDYQAPADEPAEEEPV